MAKLIYAIVGAASNAFPVDIDAGQLVGDLKKAIMAKRTRGSTQTSRNFFWPRRRVARG
ncbi:hypothetical protein Plhal703r1_c55g0160591 [Plasmopara halstedii]